MWYSLHVASFGSYAICAFVCDIDFYVGIACFRVFHL